ncbi:MAG: UrcA family protein [Allosphingosinicella sp.]
MKTLLPLAALAAALVAHPASAQTAPAAPQIIRYADLDLSNPAGVRELDRRIGAAIRDACGGASDADLHGQNLVIRCRVEARGQAAAQRAIAVAAVRVRGDELASTH